ncbi:hypothetical protein MLD38_004653 [Melastoma candidum]|uniref:Uncharacterized protein n=1 Tax=Melastoma candidum TaxID=119954 RepID=A0ACB9S5K4_9MYRT|nr:hypothetical protein MLD38_004653 [Melastoma candidum]
MEDDEASRYDGNGEDSDGYNGGADDLSGDFKSQSLQDYGREIPKGNDKERDQGRGKDRERDRERGRGGPR